MADVVLASDAPPLVASWICKPSSWPAAFASSTRWALRLLRSNGFNSCEKEMDLLY
jgi:hypothetical protein